MKREVAKEKQRGKNSLAAIKRIPILTTSKYQAEKRKRWTFRVCVKERETERERRVTVRVKEMELAWR